MILSASRRTDIPALYMPWFINRLSEGFVLVRNPMNPHRISHIQLTRDVLDAVVFWTKNPLPMLSHLDSLTDLPYYVQFTLTPYGHDIEPKLPDKASLLNGFVQLSRLIGSQRMVWRYDPIVLNAHWTQDVHLSAFSAMAEQLSGHTDTCVVSFLDRYRCMESRCTPLHLHYPAAEEMQELFFRLSAVAQSHGMRLCTCCEDIPGALHSSCIDRVRLERIIGSPLTVPSDANQRPGCGCFASVDLGAYDTCTHGCLYCYATHHQHPSAPHLHDPRSPLLIGRPGPQDTISPRRVFSHKNTQLSFFT